MRSKILLAVLFMLLLPCCLFGSESKRTVLIVCGDHAYPPYEYLENGIPVGFNIDLIKAVAKAINLDIQIRLGPWNEVRNQLETGKADVLAGMYYSEERDLLVDFSVPHTMVTSGLFVRKGSTIRSFKDISLKHIIVQDGDIMHDFLKASGIIPRVIVVQDPSQGLQILASGQYDGALLSSELQGLYFINRLKLTNLKVVNTGLPSREYCFAVTEGNKGLLNKLNEGLNIVKSTGRYKQIHDSWFGVYESEKWWDETWKYLALPIVLFAALVAGSLAWSWSLRLRVDEQTKEIMESEKQFNTLFRESPAIICITTPDEGTLLEINEAFEKISGYDRDEVIGRTSTEIGFYVDPQDRIRVIEELERSGQAKNFELKLRCKSGRIITGLFSTTPIMIKGKPCLLTVINDITDLKHAEEEKDKLEAKLMQVQKMEAVGSLAGGIAHDFNNILTAILGYSELAIDSQKKKTVFDDNLLFVLQEIQRAAHRAANLTKQLLVFTRSEITEPEILQLDNVLNGIEKMLRRLIPENISLDISLEPGIKPILAQTHHLEQVIMNLAVNARDAMPYGGQIRIKVSNIILDEAYAAEHPQALAGPHVRLTIIDSGCGMDAQTLERIFEPFFTTKERGKGTGLGLSSVYGIVKQSGGHITVESMPGRGTTFDVYFPVSTMKSVSNAKPGDEEEIPAGNETILLCEDDDGVRQLSFDILTSAGYHVMAASSGSEALKLIRTNGHIDLLLTDLIMPGMNGKLLSEKMTSEIPGLKVLFISGYTHDIINNNGILSADEELLMKPFSRAKLLHRVRTIIDSPSG